MYFKRFLEDINVTLINSIVFLIGIVAILFSFLIPDINQNLKNILISVGCSLVASSIVTYLSSKYILKHQNLKEIIQVWGLEGIYRTRQEMNRSCDFYMKDLKDELDIIAFGLKSFRDSQSAIIEEKVKKGLKIRILTIDPNSVFLKQREKEENEIEGQIKKTILDLIQWVNDLKEIAPDDKNIGLKKYDSLPLDFYFREDDRIYIGPYLYGISSQQTISFEFKSNSQGFEYYKNYFERLWNNENFSKKDLM
ncbi:MAG TPA: hypothetical protein DHW82_03385 [Spirochaetia bacterium]|nr:MAG: hypothetical protein A2Y41_06565 [Spirochaetes bacterium GWB1_36_13]HCL56036.1 hypothetical protein [Spirochaetia bacterium]